MTCAETTDSHQDTNGNSIFFQVPLLKEVWVTYFILIATGGKEKQKSFTPALLQFHFRLEQTSCSVVAEQEVESLFTWCMVCTVQFVWQQINPGTFHLPLCHRTCSSYSGVPWQEALSDCKWGGTYLADSLVLVSLWKQWLFSTVGVIMTLW